MVVRLLKYGLLLGAAAGLIAGVLYSGIGFFIDLSQGSLNGGTALAFLALIAMPAIFAVAGVGIAIVIIVVGAMGNFALERARGRSA